MRRSQAENRTRTNGSHGAVSNAGTPMPRYDEWGHCVSLCPSNREPLSGTNQGVG